jgi:hypothetical protein
MPYVLTLENETMNINRKIQLIASSVIANGALALGLLSSSPALATTCGHTEYCVPLSTCQNDISSYCALRTPAGCTFDLGGSFCEYPVPEECSEGQWYYVVCDYT